MKANHNGALHVYTRLFTVSYGSKILKWKQITTAERLTMTSYYCFLWFKDTKMKANHNQTDQHRNSFLTVSYGSKILKWKQITTSAQWHLSRRNCFLWFKDTKMKANHNKCEDDRETSYTVSYGSKILKWKQITTPRRGLMLLVNCFLWFKDTKMKANHNWTDTGYTLPITVSYGSKILKWKQITTVYPIRFLPFLLFPMVQRY